MLAGRGAVRSSGIGNNLPTRPRGGIIVYVEGAAIAVGDRIGVGPQMTLVGEFEQHEEAELPARLIPRAPGVGPRAQLCRGEFALPEPARSVIAALEWHLQTLKCECKFFNIPGASVVILDPAAAKLVVEGGADLTDGLPDPVPAREVTYGTAALLHPGLHDELRGLSDQHIPTLPKQISSGVRNLEDVRAGAGLRILSLGVTGLPFCVVDGDVLALTAKRSSLVAVNPGAWTAPVDGGCGRETEWPRVTLRKEAEQELPREPELDWEYVGVAVAGLTGRVPRAQTGLNALFTAQVDTPDELEALRGAAQRHLQGGAVFETGDYEIWSVHDWRSRATGEPVSDVLCTALDHLASSHPREPSRVTAAGKGASYGS